MREKMLKALKDHGPMCVEDISDLLMWDEQLVHEVLVRLVTRKEVHMEIDGTYWFAREQAA